jgi:hypothetical protein
LSPERGRVDRVLAEGQALVRAGRADAAEALVRPLLATGRGPIMLWKLLALALRRQCRFDEVRRIQEMIVDTVPGDLESRYNLADTLLTLGEFERGWREYRHRYGLQHTRAMERKVQKPRWDGEACAGRTLLIHDEQGYGDSFQFLRLLHPAARRSGAKLVVQVFAEILALARRSFPELEIIPRGQLPPPFDLHCELMSLPAALRLRVDDLPGPLPYLRADPARAQRWRQRLRELPRPLVALTWAGRPTHNNDANRSMRLDMLAPLVRAGVHFVAIQKGEAAQQAAPPGLELTRLDAEIEDFDDTAAILGEVDLLLSVDSSPVHLAGALDRPAWVLLPFEAEWRWMHGRDDTPWYPRHRLLRQPRAGDWAAVLERAADALAALPRRPGADPAASASAR